LSFSPDGRLLAWQAGATRVTLCETATRGRFRTIDGIAQFAGFSPDGQWLVGVDQQASFQRWSARTALPDSQPAALLNRPLAALAGGAEGACFTTGESDASQSVRVWDFDRHVETTRLPVTSGGDGQNWEFCRSAVSGNNRVCTVALSSGQGPGTRWQLQSFDLVARKPLRADPLFQVPTFLALSPDGARLAVGLGDSAEVLLRDLESGNRLWQQKIGHVLCRTAAFSPDGSQLALAGRDSVVHIVDATTGAALNSLRGHEGGVSSLAWSPQGHLLASGSTAGDLRLWSEPAHSTHQSTGRRSILSPTTNPNGACLSRDGRRLAVSPDGGDVDIVSTETLSVLARLRGPARPICFADADRALMALTATGQLKQWRLDTSGAEAEEWRLFEDGSATLVMRSSNGQWLAAANRTGRIQLWDWRGKRRLFEQQAHPSSVRGLAFSRDGETLISVGDDRKAKSWSIRTGKLRAVWTIRGDPLGVSLSPRDGNLAVGHARGTAEVRSPDSPGITRTLHTSSARSTALVFSPDGSRLLSGGPNGMLHVFATDDWREITTLTAGSPKATLNGDVAALDFSADGRVLAAFLEDGGLRVWRR
jgi:WD40 repeat protein